MKFGDYIGIPWRLGGRERAGVDCWGLLCVFYAGEFGLRIPLYESRTGRFVRTKGGDFDQWRGVRQKPGAAALFKRPRSLHVAICANDGRFLNIEEGGMSVITPRVDGGVVGFWEPRR